YSRHRFRSLPACPCTCVWRWITNGCASRFVWTATNGSGCRNSSTRASCRTRPAHPRPRISPGRLSGCAVRITQAQGIRQTSTTLNIASVNSPPRLSFENGDKMIITKCFRAAMLVLMIAVALLAAQVKTEVPPVVPDAKTVHNGSMYSSSVTTGDFETFIARDVVAYIDAHYRTISNRLARGLVGHSMGGYGATRIGMKHADVFGSLYIMSPCCLSP